MLCRKCQKDIPTGAAFCPWCGANQAAPRRTRQRGNGMGYIYKRGNTYSLRMRTYIPVQNDDGTSTRKCIERTKGGFKTKKEAADYRDKMNGQTAKKERKTLASYWLIYERDKLCKLSRTKQVNYRTAYNRLASIQFADISLLTISDLQNVVSTTTTSFYPARDMKTLLSRLFLFAAADGIASKDLPSFIELPALKESQQQAFTLEEIDKLYALWQRGHLFAGYILLMIYTSMMPGELLHLRKSMIDIESQRIIGAGLKTKQRKTQSIVFPAFISPILETIMATAKNDLLFDGYYYEKFAKEYYETLDMAGCRRLTPYSCRHTTATALSLDPTIAPAVISRVMRHSSRMTERYTHPDDSAAIQAINKMHPI